MNDSEIKEILRRNFATVRVKIDSACHRAGRSIDDICLLPVSKSVNAKVIQLLHELGNHAFGENRLQVAEPKIQLLQSTSPAIDWHFIGHLQSKKVGKVVGCFEMIHAVDSLSLLEKIHNHSESKEIQQSVLLQIKSSRREEKSGINSSKEFQDILDVLPRFSSVACKGLMTMVDVDMSEQEKRSAFLNVADMGGQLGERLRLDSVELSMGMSGDFELAIECGSTLLRIGSLLFDGLAPALRI